MLYNVSAMMKNRAGWGVTLGAILALRVPSEVSGDISHCHSWGPEGGVASRATDAHDPRPRPGITQLKRSVVKAGHFDEIITEWRLLWGKGAHQVGSWRQRFQVEERANAKSVIRERLVCFENSKDPASHEQRRNQEMRSGSGSCKVLSVRPSALDLILSVIYV